MEETLLDGDGLTLTKRNGRFFVRYDAGAHIPQVREDEITAAQAEHLLKGREEATQVLFALQRRLLSEGVDPYGSNLL